MRTTRPRLSDSVAIGIKYDDRTAFGSIVDDEIDRRIRARCQNIIDARASHGIKAVVARSQEFLSAALESPALGELYCGRGQLREDCLYPDAALVTPSALTIDRDGERTTIPLAKDLVSDLAAWLGEWARGSAAPSTGPARALWLSLEQAGALDEGPSDPPIHGADITFVGHATVAHRAGSSSILIDPYLLPRSGRHPAQYQPITAAELAPVDAIFITHPHPDHFDVGSLLRFGRDMPIYVPAVERESLLSIDMAYRLKQLGFSQVRRLQWFAEVRIGELRVVALPFRGEQPTCGERYHPEVSCAGNTYLVEGDGRRAAYVADSGVDAAGDVKQVAAQARGKFGAIDVLFGSHRGFPVYPIQYLFSSVAQYLLFVPQEAWTCRQQIMNDSHDLLDTAECWGARRVVPYASGGAPWYWEMGLGPRPPAVGGRYSLADPPPEAAADAQEARAETREGFIPSAVDVCVLHPGEGLDMAAGSTVHLERHIWPYGPLRRARAEIDHDPMLLLRGGEEVAVVRKKVLLQILALAEAERRTIGVLGAELQEMADTFRRRYGLLSPVDLASWMKTEGLDKRNFAETMRDFVVVEKLCETFAPQIDEMLATSLRVNTARNFVAGRQPTQQQARPMTTLDNIERIPAPPSEALFRDYIRLGRPVILTDLFDRLPIRAIDTADAARRNLGEVPLQVQPNYIGALLAQGRTADPQTMSLAQFLEVLERQPDVDLCCTEYPTPSGILNLVGTPEPCGLNDSSDVVSTMFFAGTGNFAHMHFDGDFRDVLMYQAVGTKRYVVIHPRETRKLDPFVDAGIERTSSVFLQNFSEADKAAFLRYTNAWDCVLQPGETLLMPMMAWHYVEYLEPAMSISFRLGRNRYCRFFAEQMPLRSIFLQAISQRFIDEAALGPDDLAVFSELEDACRRPYPSATARRLEIDRLCLDIWQRITARDERNPYTVRDLRRIQGIQARSASAPAASDS
jgi:L-ascorbate metabolism protein UlaG (beta-lactamase superfamily)